MKAEGRGNGRGAMYRPWLEVTDLSSRGRSRRVWSPKTGRTHHLFSDVEYGLFLLLEWSREVVDIREQYPLERELTQDMARTLGIRHPCYPGTHVPTVMTVDFVVTFQRGADTVIEAFDAKRDEEAEDERSILKLELQRATMEAHEVPHHLVFHSQLPPQKVRNIGWIRDALVKDGELEPQPGFFASLSSRMSSELASGHIPDASLSTYCADFDARHGLEQGSGLRAARLLLNERVLKCNLDSADLTAESVSSFVVTAHAGRLRAIGGR
jgi:hypothetical protein